jgi:hypothetical protein
MKISNLIILSVISLFFLGTLGTNLALKKEFDKIDKDDPTYGFSKEALKPFRYIRLQGSGFGVTEIRRGPATQIQTIVEHKYIDWKVSNDTLIVNYKADWNKANEFGDVTGKPSVYISSPQIAAISSDMIRYRIMKSSFDDLTLDQKGLQVMLLASSVKNLRVKVTSGGSFRLDGKNDLGDTSFEIRDSSSLEIDKDKFASLKTRIDTTAIVQVPGHLINAMKNM